VGTAFSNLMRAFRYGRPVIVVSGLPRSGTSMLMNMLSAGGLQLVSDNNRIADRDNPKGYYEDERVKSLGSTADKSWVREARGKGIKVISHLLRSLPADNFYRILLARRELSEIIVSQNKMLDRLGEPNPIEDEKAMALYEKHLKEVRSLVGVRSNFELLEVHYSGVINEPGVWADKIRNFLQLNLDPERMREIVDKSLYRNRIDKGEEL